MPERAKSTQSLRDRSKDSDKSAIANAARVIERVNSSIKIQSIKRIYAHDGVSVEA